MTSPILETERLILRAPLADDFDAFARFTADDRSKWVGGPFDTADTRDAFDTWMSMASEAPQGGCYLSIVRRDTGDSIGRAGVRSGDDRPESEVAYALYSQADEGQGFATEAAVALRDWGFDALGCATLVSYIDPANTRSAALALRSGAVLDKDAAQWPKYDGLDVYRHSKRSSS